MNDTSNEGDPLHLPFGLDWEPYLNDGFRLRLDGETVAMVTKPFSAWQLITNPGVPSMRHYWPSSLEQGQRFAERWAVKYIDQLHAQIIATRRRAVGVLGPPQGDAPKTVPRKKRAPRRGPRLG